MLYFYFCWSNLKFSLVKFLGKSGRSESYGDEMGESLGQHHRIRRLSYAQDNVEEGAKMGERKN